jgi:nitrite reductase (NO-forming)
MIGRKHAFGLLAVPALILAGCGGLAQEANNPVGLYQQASSPKNVQAREDAANGTTMAIPNPRPAVAGGGAPGVITGPLAGAGDSMPGMDMGASTAASPAPSAAPIAAPAPKAYDATLPALDAETVHHITLTAREGVQEIAPGMKYSVMTFDGTAPGPIIHVKQGDTVEFTLKNEGTMQHSIDFHAAETPWNLNYRSINPGESLSFSFKADHPGAFMYHCGTAPALMHIADGMYGAIIVDPPAPLAVAKDYVLVQSEFYAAKPGKDGVAQGDYPKMQNGAPDYVVFNGLANQYTGDNALTAQPGQRIRLWVVNAGPNDFSAFHVVGAILDKVYPDGNPANVLSGMQTYTVPPGGGAMVELSIPNEGWYPVVSHSFADASKGAMAMIKVGNPPPVSGGHS